MEQSQMVHSPPGYRVIGVQEAEERFQVSADVAHSYAEFADDQEIRLYEGGLRITGNLAPEPEQDWVLYNIVVDGDLVLHGDLDWFSRTEGSFLLVTGNLRARHVILDGRPDVVVRGKLEANGVVHGWDEDHDGCCSDLADSGKLTVRGATRAALIVVTSQFRMDFGARPQALIAGAPECVNPTADLDEEGLTGLLEPELLYEDGRPDPAKVADALRTDRPVVRFGVDLTPPASAQGREGSGHPRLDSLLERAEEVTEIDLAYSSLEDFPEQLLRFPNLRFLSLEGTEVGRIDERIGELTSLEVLRLDHAALTELPDSIGRLPNLRRLDISNNAFTALPDSLGDLDRLEVLRAGRLTCPLPASLARLGSLRHLSLPHLHHGLHDDSPAPLVDFPDLVLRLTGLRSLDLSDTWLASVPDDLLNLTELEELYLARSLSDRVTRLPDLARLPRLRALRLSGHTPEQAPPGRDLLAGIWDIPTLEYLEIDGWGEAVVDGDTARTPFTALPDGACARTPNLRYLDLAHNELTTLPEPFFALRHLEFANLRATCLDRATVDRVRDTHPGAHLVLEDIAPRPAAADPTRQQVRDLVRTAAEKLYGGTDGDVREAVASYEAALALCVPGAHYSDHDRLHAYHGLIEALSSILRGSPAPDHPELTAKLIHRAEQALSLLPDHITTTTDEGHLQAMVKRHTGNALAWYLLHSGEPERALTAVEQALSVADDPGHDWVRDTQVRVLLALGRTDEAYRVTDEVLSRVPSYLLTAGIVLRDAVFGDLTDIVASPGFQQWREARRDAQQQGSTPA
ncbi:hypothetical protein [Streptomyces sp. TRM68416]|uniref:leucine-rich repeat domain-containing protein n=1 Tax=Streptomyces sp. TRM68416 TaxID=2758412 RepID=UPI0016620ADF|nr:hypothetical protein [Streptomyces sp. TRM68416]MBD0841516.1 hypothetical protein [Streptomyces sp. TRM68416]